MKIRDEPASYDVPSAELVYRSGRVIDVSREQVTMPGGETTTRDVVGIPAPSRSSRWTTRAGCCC